ncbi:Rha family transcriptional regulator [Escherichia coli]|uniref:Rha family transcriptional regulator n=1 Tax=Escherichia coli TaxID=562 RepID=UPI00193C4328|nr:Rha family transcriptional regulator [Escherichia coli]MBM3004881.1 Rha family transcriptional regulator [Escherichia coli]HBB8952340.1 Rha family transcriptional regulator [Escherichia coli]
MNTLTLINDTKQPMMGSRKIAEVTGKQHMHVVRDILAMLEQLQIYSPDLDDYDFKGFIIKRKEYKGRDVIDEIWLDENLSMTLVTGYDAKRRLALIEQWQAMKIELERPRQAALPTPIHSAPTHQINDGIVQLARVIAEATASATMKAMAEVITIPTCQTGPAYLPNVEGEYVPVTKAAWKTGLSDSTCRKLIGFARIPTRSTGCARGLQVNLPAIEQAAQKLLNESTPPKGNRKRWTHPQFGNFTYYADLI